MGLPGADDRLRAQRSVEGRRPASGGSSRGEGHKTAALFVNKQCRGVHSLRALGGGAGRLGAARVEGGRGIRHLCALPRGVQLNALGLKVPEYEGRVARGAVGSRAAGEALDRRVHCPRREPPFRAVKRPVRPCASDVRTRFTAENAKGA
jgi:hypothetical protein